MKYIVAILILLSTSFAYADDTSFYFWTNITDTYTSPYTDTGSIAQNCGLKYFRYKKDIEYWYKKVKRRIRNKHVNNGDVLIGKLKYLRLQRDRLIFDYDSRRLSRWLESTSHS